MGAHDGGENETEKGDSSQHQLMGDRLSVQQKRSETKQVKVSLRKQITLSWSWSLMTDVLDVECF